MTISALWRASLLISICANTPQKSLSKEFFEDVILRHHPPEPFEAAPQKMSFFDVFNEFLDKHFDGAPLSGHYRALARLLRRFELYGQKTTRTKFTLILNDFDYAEIERFK